MCSTAWQVPLVLSNPKLIVSFDPGVPCTFLLFRVDSVSPTVIMCGTADVRNEDAPLRSLGGEQAPSSFETLRQMLDSCDLIVWEKQRGWLHEHVEVGFLGWCLAHGRSVRVIPPSEKYHRLCVTEDKQQAVTCAMCHFEHVPGPLFDVLSTGPVDEIHDIADAALLLVMALELEAPSVPSLRALYDSDHELPWRLGWRAPDYTRNILGRCKLAREFATIYASTDQNVRNGANIPRRYRVRRRLRCCAVRVLAQASEFRPRTRSLIRLTRKALEHIGMSKSEASDLCVVLESFRRTILRRFGNTDGCLVTHSSGAQFTLWAPLQTGRLARFAIHHTDVNAFNQVLRMNP